MSSTRDIKRAKDRAALLRKKEEDAKDLIKVAKCEAAEAERKVEELVEAHAIAKIEKQQKAARAKKVAADRAVFEKQVHAVLMANDKLAQAGLQPSDTVLRQAFADISTRFLATAGAGAGAIAGGTAPPALLAGAVPPAGAVAGAVPPAGAVAGAAPPAGAVAFEAKRVLPRRSAARRLPAGYVADTETDFGYEPETARFVKPCFEAISTGYDPHDICCVCHIELQHGAVVHSFCTGGGHDFHRECYFKTLAHTGACPMCRHQWCLTSHGRDLYKDLVASMPPHLRVVEPAGDDGEGDAGDGDAGDDIPPLEPEDPPAPAGVAIPPLEPEDPPAPVGVAPAPAGVAPAPAGVAPAPAGVAPAPAGVYSPSGDLASMVIDDGEQDGISSIRSLYQ